MTPVLTNGHSSIGIPSLARYAGFEDVYIDQANQLTVRDLFSLHPTLGDGWLTSSVIDSYLNILTKSCPGNICFIKSEAATLIANNITPRGKPFDALNLNFVKKMAFPINVLRSHWTLVVVDHQNKKVMKYDPAGNEANLMVESSIIQWYASHKLCRFEKKILREAFDDGQDDFVDRSGSDGGVWILYEVWKIARDDIAFHERPSPDELRVRFFVELINGSILEETKLYPTLLSKALHKLDRIVKSSAISLLNSYSIQSYEDSADQFNRGCQTDDLLLKFSLNDLLRIQHVSDAPDQDTSHMMTDHGDGISTSNPPPLQLIGRGDDFTASPPLNGNHDEESPGLESADEQM